jgi:hypothetical protein
MQADMLHHCKTATLRRGVLIGIAILGIALLFLAIGQWSAIRPKVLAKNKLEFLRREIVSYVKREGHFPRNLEELPKIEGFENATTDPWGHRFIYSVESSALVSLRTLGSDGRVGGVGDAEDLSLSFNVEL